MQPLLLSAVDPAVRMALTQRVVKNICMEPLSNFVSHSTSTINDFSFFVNSQLSKLSSFSAWSKTPHIQQNCITGYTGF